MTLPRLLAAVAVLALAACSAQKAPTPLPRPAVSPTPRPAPQPQPLPPAGPLAWMDLPATPGDWSYGATAEGSRAMFGQPGSAPLLILACNRPASEIELNTVATRPAVMRVLTQFTNRLLETRIRGTQLTATLAGNDPLLDSMAFSRGRFAVEIEGAPTLYMPAWPEVARVIEDCR